MKNKRDIRENQCFQESPHYLRFREMAMKRGYLVFLDDFFESEKWKGEFISGIIEKYVLMIHRNTNIGHSETVEKNIVILLTP